MSVRSFIRPSVPLNLLSATLLRPLYRISWNFQELFTTWCHTAPPILSFYSNDFGVPQSKTRTLPYKTWGSGGYHFVSIAHSISSFWAVFGSLQCCMMGDCYCLVAIIHAEIWINFFKDQVNLIQNTDFFISKEKNWLRTINLHIVVRLLFFKLGQIDLSYHIYYTDFIVINFMIFFLKSMC